MRPYHALVVEAHPDQRVLLVDALQALDFVVLLAKHGEEAIHVARTERPDLILIDVSLPSADGYACVQQIKRDPALAAIPILALTSHGMIGDRLRALEAGCDDWLSKPIQMRDLREKARRCAGRHVQAGQGDLPTPES
jgi:CheY-like chemotaxis protein